MLTISTNVLAHQDATNSHTDFQEMPHHAVDARDVTGHHKSQTQLVETDVLPDQDQAALVLKDMETKDIHALNAHSVKLEAEPTKNNVFPQANAQVLTKSDLLLMPHHAVNARLANSQDLSQMFQELNVLPDHLLSALIALPDNQLMDTHANNAQLDKFKMLTTPRDATPQPVLDNTKSDSPLTTLTVEDVRLANGQHTCQMPPETNASLDQEPSATAATPDNQMMDTHVLPAQPVKSKIQTILKFAMFQLAQESMISNFQSTTDHAENAKHALSQDKFQTTRELPVSTDHSLNAQIALPEDLLTTTLVSNAHSDKFKTQLT
jgi:hypothetical protein